MLLSTALACLLSPALVLAVISIIRHQNMHHLPPGPKPKLISGNLADLEAMSWLTYTKWRKIYGDIIYIRLFNQKIVILNSLASATALLEKRSNIYSSRPYIPMLNLLGLRFIGAFLPYGNLWRRQRKLYQQGFQQAVLYKYYDSQTNILKKFLRSLLSEDDPWKYIDTIGAELLLKIVYGYDIDSTEDVALSNANYTMHYFAYATMPGYSVINALQSLPLSWIQFLLPLFPKTKRYIETGRKYTEDLLNLQFDDLKRKMALGIAPSSITTKYLKAVSSFAEEEDVRAVSGSAIAAGADTTTATLTVFFLAMVMHPEVQKRAHEELDTVVGSQRLPNHADRLQLPYIEAIYREVMRWYPVAPIGLSHELIQDDVYDGYYIPRGTSVIANIWAMTHDESTYKDPFVFNPERYFVDGKLNDDNRILAFGFGRRICSGQHFASSMLWITMAYILSALEISKAKDTDGRTIEVKATFTLGHISRPDPFPFCVTPRSTSLCSVITDDLSQS